MYRSALSLPASFLLDHFCSHTSSCSALAYSLISTSHRKTAGRHSPHTTQDQTNNIKMRASVFVAAPFMAAAYAQSSANNATVSANAQVIISHRRNR